ncbi:MAG: ribosomal protein S12 methylthiotransferase RimO [Pirellulaceae bacterium]|nr:MAG: ribosomal protein S12 methylthiotransferase RimO [Pirellulaceae bacterium]
MNQLPIIEPPSAIPKNEIPEPNFSRGRYAFVSLGCPKNLVDSERMLGVLRDEGFELVADPEQSDFVVINTCGFIDRARAESLEAIDQMLELKAAKRIKGVIVAGCLAERAREELLQERPQIDALVGVFGRDEVRDVARRMIDGLELQRSVFRPAPIRALDDTQRLRITPPHFAYLKISEGCDRLCTFCAIPKMRGKHVSKPMEEVLREARELVASGVRELIIVAQDTTYYGIDLYGQPTLTRLLQALEEVDGLDWIRLMYFYPMYIDDALIETIAQSEKILPYIDMPLQHINDHMLRRMARRVDSAGIRQVVRRLRDRIDDLVVRTTFITGFPGETDAQFAELEAFIEEARFERVGVFTYSLEPDTPAAKLPGQIAEEVKEERRQRLMAAQQLVAFQWCDAQIGNAVEVIIDQQIDAERRVWLGRSYADAPDVDAAVYVTADPRHHVAVGQIVPVEIVARRDYDLVAASIDSGR